MAMNISLEEMEELKPQITVFGVGGAGGNAINNMITSGLTGVSFVVANTDAQALLNAQAVERIQIGRAITQGLGAGARPEIGRAAAEENLSEIVEQLKGSHMCFIAAGMGGGTGTGAAPVIARAAKEMNILTVGVVTKPFQFEGAHRMKLATEGIEELHQYVDTLIVIPNQNLFRIANERTTFTQAFQLADQVLHSGVRGVTDLMLLPGLINLDFADVRSVMSEMGKAMMGTGEGEGDHRAIAAAEAAISNPLLDDVSLKGARAVLINITGGDDLTLFDVDEATNRIRNDVDPEANIIFGAVFNEQMTGKVRVSVVATGIDGARPAQIPQSFMEAVSPASRIEVTKLEPKSETVSRSNMTASYGSNTKISQPMFPGGNESWHTKATISEVSPEHKSQQTDDKVQSLSQKPIIASPSYQQSGVTEHNNNPVSYNPQQNDAVDNKAETVDDIVSQLSKQKNNINFSQGNEKPEDTGIKGFFGLMGNNKKANDKKEEDSRPIEIKETEKSASKAKEDDSFEIPAFLRRSLY
jgi:cell division protein FtsZ